MTDIVPLSNIDVINKLQKYGVHVKFIRYEDIRYVKNIDDILPCLLLYQLHSKVGHWVALFRDQVNHQVNYFDPIGKIPDQILENFDHPRGRGLMGANFTYLLNLMKKIDETIVYNEVHLQDPPTTNTCGYWCTIRLLTQNVTNDQFNECWKGISSGERQRKIVKFYNLL